LFQNPLQGPAAAKHGRLFLLFALFLLFVFLTGGASRSEVMSLPFLRVVSALVIGFALVGISRAEIDTVRKPLILCGVMAVLILLQLIPLPPSIWTSLPGRAPLLDTYAALGTDPGWRPINMVPYLGWNSLFSLIVPIAALLAFSRLHWMDKRRTLLALVGVALISALLAVLQISGEPGGSAYLYAITNPTAGVGLFSNRNHQGFLIAAMIPALVACWQLGQGNGGFPRIGLPIVAGLILFMFVLLLATGSRAALLLGGGGLIAALVLVPPTARSLTIGFKKKRQLDLRIALPVAAIAITAVLTLLTDRTEAINRLADQSFDEELRFALWPPIGEMLRTSFPVGFGVGTFAEMYRWFEPESLLRLSYVNQAHNDLFDLFLSFGILGALPLLLGLYYWVRALPAALRPTGRQSFDDLLMRRLGLLLVLILAGASLVDYPLRVPSLAVLFVLAVAWATGASEANDDRDQSLR
jgi:O-antigen ligase